MNIEVRYLSRGGNTKKVAEAIARAAGAEAFDVGTPVTEPTDLLFLGGAYYAFNLGEELIGFIDALDPALIKAAAVFGTSGLMKGVTKKIAALLKKRGIRVIKERHYCKCKVSKDDKTHPDERDLEAAAAFAESAVKGLQA